MKKLMSLLLALAMIVSLAACGAQDSASSQGETSDKGSTTETSSKWPEKEIKIIQPWSLGGGPDVITRQIASYSDKILGVPMIVENHTGGSGTIGMNTFLEAEDDGYTLNVLGLIRNFRHTSWLSIHSSIFFSLCRRQRLSTRCTKYSNLAAIPSKVLSSKLMMFIVVNIFSYTYFSFSVGVSTANKSS